MISGPIILPLTVQSTRLNLLHIAGLHNKIGRISRLWNGVLQALGVWSRSFDSLATLRPFGFHHKMADWPRSTQISKACRTGNYRAGNLEVDLRMSLAVTYARWLTIYRFLNVRSAMTTSSPSRCDRWVDLLLTCSSTT